MRATGNVALAMGQPFLEHPIAFEATAPDYGGDVASEGFAIEEDVEGSAGEGREDTSHRRAFAVREIALHSAAPVRLPAVTDAGRIAAVRLAVTQRAITDRSFGAFGFGAPFALPAGNAINGVRR